MRRHFKALAALALLLAFSSVARAQKNYETPPGEAQAARVRDFFGRPFRVIELHGFSGALLRLITDERVRRIAARRPIGGVDTFSDSTDLVSHAAWRDALRKLYE